MGQFGIYQVLSKIQPADQKVRIEFETEHGPILVWMNSQRYHVFRTSLKCVECGIRGQYFALEREEKHAPNIGHFNLYAVDHSGQEVLMTKDHIVPRSKGGRNWLSNYQTMCATCNTKKGAKHE